MLYCQIALPLSRVCHDFYRQHQLWMNWSLDYFQLRPNIYLILNYPFNPPRGSLKLLFFRLVQRHYQLRMDSCIKYSKSRPSLLLLWICICKLLLVDHYFADFCLAGRMVEVLEQRRSEEKYLGWQQPELRRIIKQT